MWRPKPDPIAEGAAKTSSLRRRYLEFAFAFVCVFAGLALPSPGIGPLFVRMHTALGNMIVAGPAGRADVTLRFEAGAQQLAEHPWQTTLIVAPAGPAQPLLMPIDLRSLMFLPTVAFIALVLAAPLGSWRRNARLLLLGLPLLELLLIMLMALPLLSFLGGTGPVRAFTLSTPVHAVLQVLYRALVAPPGMAYALPLLVWWCLLGRTRPRLEPASAAANTAA
jgi:hypothetical protein